MHATKTNLNATAPRGLGLGLFALALVATVALWNLTLSPSATADEGPLAPTGVSAAPPSFADVIETVKPAVVNISVRGHLAVPVPGQGPGMPSWSRRQDGADPTTDGHAPASTSRS